MARVYGRRRVAVAPQARASLLVRALEGLHLSTQMLLPALGSIGLRVVHGESLIGKLLMFGWLPILVFQLLDFAHHRPPRSTTAALVMALAVPGELALTHARFGDTPLLRGGDREGIAALIVLGSIGAPMIAWVVVPFWTARSDDPRWLAGMVFGVVLGVVTWFIAMRGGPVGGDKFAGPWTARGFVLWILAILVAFYAL